MVPRACSLLQIITLSLFAGEYYFTYTIKSKNLEATYDKLIVSKKITPQGTKPNIFFEIENDKNAKDEKEFLEKYKSEIALKILEHKALIHSTQKTTNLTIEESLILRSTPTVVSVDFKEDFGIIGVYE